MDKMIRAILLWMRLLIGVVVVVSKLVAPSIIRERPLVNTVRLVSPRTWLVFRKIRLNGVEVS